MAQFGSAPRSGRGGRRFKSSRPDHSFRQQLPILSLDALQASAATIIVSGHVQGVGFRFFTSDLAETLGITGWVKNRSDGRVEIEAHGFRAVIEKMVVRLRQGPPRASVTDIAVIWHSAELSVDTPREFCILG